MKNKSHLDVQKPAEACYNMDGVVIMTSRKITRFSSEMPTFIICVTTFVCEETHQSAYGNGVQVCYEQRQGQQSKHPSASPQILALINYKCVSLCQTLPEKTHVLHVICPT